LVPSPLLSLTIEADDLYMKESDEVKQGGGTGRRIPILGRTKQGTRTGQSGRTGRRTIRMMDRTKAR
jgi:hypothetical protein